jgi:hypothetical protein
MSPFVTQSTQKLEDIIEVHILDTDNPHEVTASQIGAISTSEKGMPTGIATLDSNGQLPSAQNRPSNVGYNPTTGAFTFTWADGSTQTINNIYPVEDFKSIAIRGYPNAYSVAIQDGSGVVTRRDWRTSANGTLLLRWDLSYPSDTVTIRTETNYRGSSPVSRTVTITQVDGFTYWEIVPL